MMRTNQRNKCRVKQKVTFFFVIPDIDNEKDSVICEVCQKIFENKTKLKEHDK